jgi:RNA recognition motif-containing protein
LRGKVQSREEFKLYVIPKDEESGRGKRREVGMNKNLYIGNLSNEVTEEDLKANFSEVGKVVSVTVIKDKYTGLSRGFGFVEMETEKEAQEAMQKFNGGELHGNVITVNEARPKKEQGGMRGEGGGRGGGFRGDRGGGGGRRF